MWIIYVEWIVVTYINWTWNNKINDVYEKQIIITLNANVPDVVIPIVPPVHSTSLGSGSHSPFPIHVDELDPLSVQ